MASGNCSFQVACTWLLPLNVTLYSSNVFSLCRHVFQICDDCIRAAVQQNIAHPICRHQMTMSQIHKSFIE